MSFKPRCFHFLQSEVPKNAALTHQGQTVVKYQLILLISFPVCCEDYLFYPSKTLGLYITSWILNYLLLSLALKNVLNYFYYITIRPREKMITVRIIGI